MYKCDFASSADIGQCCKKPLGAQLLWLSALESHVGLPETVAVSIGLRWLGGPGTAMRVAGILPCEGCGQLPCFTLMLLS